MGVIMRRDDGCGTAVKGNDGSKWSSDGMVLMLGRIQNGDTFEWWGEWPRLRWPFYSSGGWESRCSARVAEGSGADSMVQYRLKRGGIRTKHYRKIKWRQ
jgi:hypothetical protein